MPEAFAAATGVLNDAPAGAGAITSNSHNSILALRTLEALARDGEELPADTPLVAIDANELEFDANGVSTGGAPM